MSTSLSVFSRKGQIHYQDDPKEILNHIEDDDHAVDELKNRMQSIQEAVTNVMAQIQLHNKTEALPYEERQLLYLKTSHHIEHTLFQVQHLFDYLTEDISLRQRTREHVQDILKETIPHLLNTYLNLSLSYPQSARITLAQPKVRESIFDSKMPYLFYPEQFRRQKLDIPTHKGEETYISGHHDIFRRYGGAYIISDAPRGPHSRYHNGAKPDCPDARDGDTLRKELEHTPETQRNPQDIKDLLAHQHHLAHSTYQNALELPSEFDRININTLKSLILHILILSEEALDLTRRNDFQFWEYMITQMPDRLHQYQGNQKVQLSSDIKQVLKKLTPKANKPLTPEQHITILEQKIRYFQYHVLDHQKKMRKNLDHINQIRDLLYMSLNQQELPNTHNNNDDPFHTLHAAQKNYQRFLLESEHLQDKIFDYLEYIETLEQIHNQPDNKVIDIAPFFNQLDQIATHIS